MRLDHGGSLAVRKRRAKRPINPRKSLHITLKSHHAISGRCLYRHKKLILKVMRKAQKLFHVRVYEYVIASNHMHLLVKAYDRESLQNFFRVFAGHTAQGILKVCPLAERRGGAPPAERKREPCKKNQRRFWSYLLYSRVVNWGRDFIAVTNYIQRHVLESLNIIAYTPRGRIRFALLSGAHTNTS